jgi:hypothetical protein
MLCPCCGIEMNKGARECGCGARFVGEPLDQKPVKIQSYGAVMNSVGLLTLVVVTALAFTKFLAFGAILVIWSAWRAMKLAKRDPEGYGGYKIATATLLVTLIAGLGIASYAIAYIPKFLDNREARRTATTKASFYHTANLLDDYKRTHGSYPRNTQEFSKSVKEPMPADFWENTIKYASYTERIADASGKTGTGFSNFELRSKGPDEIEGTDDDIIMRDGIFYTAEEIRKQILVKASAEKK